MDRDARNWHARVARMRVPLGGSTMSLQRERTLILTVLLILTAASWAILIWQSRTANTMGMGLTMGMGAALFLAIWVVMMIAMMFPAAALIWTLFGGLIYLGANVSGVLAQQVPWLMMNASRIVGGIVVLAGLYQLTPLKRVCLAKCCTPLDFILHSWRDGYPGAFRMGLEHGIYCLGCYWLLFVLLFPLGMMNIAAMALLTALIFAEKVVPRGARIAQFAALALILYGALVIVVPAALPLGGAGM